MTYHHEDLPFRRLAITTNHHFDDLPSRQRITISTTYNHDESPFRRLIITTMNHHFDASTIVLEGTSTLFYMMDQYFGSDSLEPFECIFIGSTGLTMAFVWIASLALRMRGYQHTFPHHGTSSF